MKRRASRTLSLVHSSAGSPISYYLKGNTNFIPTEFNGSSDDHANTVHVTEDNIWYSNKKGYKVSELRLTQ